MTKKMTKREISTWHNLCVMDPSGLTAKAVDKLVASSAKMSGVKMNWHYIGGRPVIYAQKNPDKASMALMKVELLSDMAADAARG